MDEQIENGENPIEFKMDAGLEYAFFTALANIPEAESFLRMTMGLDVQRHWTQKDDRGRGHVEGLYARARYFRKMLALAKEGKLPKR